MISGNEKDSLKDWTDARAGVATEAPLIMPNASRISSVKYATGFRLAITIFVALLLRVTADDEAFDGIWKVDVDAGRILHHLGADRYAGLGKAYQATLPEDDGKFLIPMRDGRMSRLLNWIRLL